jgi:hypothetical protein
MITMTDAKSCEVFCNGGDKLRVVLTADTALLIFNDPTHFIQHTAKVPMAEWVKLCEESLRAAVGLAGVESN